VNIDLSPGENVLHKEEEPNPQNRFGWIRLRNVSGMTVDRVTLKWTKIN
jgi:hypothetical protein